MIDFINNNLSLILSVLGTIITAIGGYLSSLYKKYVNSKIVKQIIEVTVKYVEQTSKNKNISSKSKFNTAKEKVIEWLNEKGIKYSETEIEILIESTVNELNTKKGE